MIDDGTRDAARAAAHAEGVFVGQHYRDPTEDGLTDAWIVTRFSERVDGLPGLSTPYVTLTSLTGDVIVTPVYRLLRRWTLTRELLPRPGQLWRSGEDRLGAARYWILLDQGWPTPDRRTSPDEPIKLRALSPRTRNGYAIDDEYAVWTWQTLRSTFELVEDVPLYRTSTTT
jgi:hypothetical protein